MSERPPKVKNWPKYYKSQALRQTPDIIYIGDCAEKFREFKQI